MYYCCKEGLTISGTILLLELVIWMVVKELLHFCMTGLNELIICVQVQVTDIALFGFMDFCHVLSQDVCSVENLFTASAL